MDLNGTYDVKAYGAVGNGEQDDAPAIQNTIQTANSRGGGLVWFPPGIYRLDTGLMISGQVLLAGSGWQVPTGHGSWLYVTRDSVAPISVTESPTDGRGAIIRDIAIRY